MTTTAAISVGRSPHDRTVIQAGYSIPKPPQPQLRSWIAAGETVRFSGVDIPGPVYFGAQIRDGAYEIEPSVIDPDLQVAVAGEFDSVKGSVWVTYASLCPNERRGYLAWLAGGRESQEVDSRLIFLFMFGLERRAIIEAPRDAKAAADIPSIVEELERLQMVYASRREVVNAIYGLLHWINNPGPVVKLYQQKDAAFHRAHGLKAYTLIAVGQCAADGKPVPANLARTWLLQGGHAYNRDIQRLYKEQFEGLFDDLYKAVFGDGIVLPMTSKKARLYYRAFNPAIAAHPDLSRDIGNVADVEELHSEAKKVKAVFEAATREIERYETIIRKRPHALFSLDVLTQLPIRLWQPESRQAIRDLIGKSQACDFVLPASELVQAIDPMAEPTKANFSLATELLAGMGLAVEPPLITITGRAVKPETPAMLLPIEILADEPQDADIDKAALEFAIATAVLSEKPARELSVADWLSSQLKLHAAEEIKTSWKMRARIAGLAHKAPTTAEAKRAAAAIHKDRAEVVAILACNAAIATGEPNTQQVKLLEKLFMALGLEKKRVSGDLHAAAAGNQRQTTSGFALDPARIKQLQQDTTKVGKMLSGIFSEEHPTAEPAKKEQSITSAAALVPDPATPGLLGLDPAHSELATEMLTKATWERADLEAIARRLDLMIDGALERINEAAFDVHDMPFTEGDSPIEINPELLEILK